jgi:hypothetical protein
VGRATKRCSAQRPPNFSSTNSILRSFSGIHAFPFLPTTFALLTNTDSGDDHDYCEYVHTSHERRVPEVTIKSLSIAMGVHQPGFQLLSLSSEARTNAHQPCLLPDQLRIYCWVYGPLILATIVLVAVRALIAARLSHQRHAQKRSLDLPLYPTSRQPRPVPSRRQSYRLRLAEDIWAVTWPPLAVYVVITLLAFW